VFNNNNNNKKEEVVVVHNELHIKRIQLDVKEIFGIDLSQKVATNWLNQMSFDDLRAMFFTMEDDLRNGYCKIKSSPIGFVNGCIAKGGYTSMKPVNSHSIRQAELESKIQDQAYDDDMPW
jgi:stage III sporulation protein SpoIIIAA